MTKRRKGIRPVFGYRIYLDETTKANLDKCNARLEKTDEDWKLIFDDDGMDDAMVNIKRVRIMPREFKKDPGK
jgi:hypothetical protein